MIRTMTLACFILIAGPVVAKSGEQTGSGDSPNTLRVATYNVSLYGQRSGEVAERLATGNDSQARRLARVIQSARPDLLLLCEIDHDRDGRTLDLFADRYLAEPQGASPAIEYPYRWSIPSNTGLLADEDLDGDGRRSLPADAWGYGTYPGQYAMAVLSRYPLQTEQIRTFQSLRWADFPDAKRPRLPGQDYFHAEEVWRSLRLSSKNHVDVPVRIGHGDRTIHLHLLASHPTPPVFDGPADENGCRNHDEILFWHHYLSGPRATQLIDDEGVAGGLPAGERFVLAGDLNSDPDRGDSRRTAIKQLLRHPRIEDPMPKNGHGDPFTAQFGNGDRVRVDYVLPSSNWRCVHAGVVWPQDDDPLASSADASDHRLVWVDLELP